MSCLSSAEKYASAFCPPEVSWRTLRRCFSPGKEIAEADWEAWLGATLFCAALLCAALFCAALFCANTKTAVKNDSAPSTIQTGPDLRISIHSLLKNYLQARGM